MVTKLTQTSYALLAILDCYGEMTSYGIKEALLAAPIESFWPVPHTTAYQEPARLAEGGYLFSQQERGGRRRRYYRITEAGRDALRRWAEEPVAAVPLVRDELMLKIFAGADPEALIVERIAAHKSNVDELRGRAGQAEPASWEGLERSLRWGLDYHLKMIELFEDLRAGSPS